MSSDSKNITCPSTKPLLDNSSPSNRSSNSSESSDVFSGKTFPNTSTHDLDSDPSEDNLLLSYNTCKKYGKNEDPRKVRPTLYKQSIVQSQEIVL